MRTVQLLGSTTLARVALPWLLERGGARVVGLDPGEEDEARPWFAPVRGLCRELGVPLGRRDADLVLDLDPDARRTGAGVRIAGPLGVTPDLCRALLPGGQGVWRALYGDGVTVWAALPLPVRPGDDAPCLLNRATLHGVEALAAGWLATSGDPHPGMAPGRFRLSESSILWEQPADVVLARIRALAGPWGGARCHFGETPIAIESAEPADADPAFSAGTIVQIDHGIVIACGGARAGPSALRVLSLRPSWRPLRQAAEYAIEVGAGPGYQMC